MAKKREQFYMTEAEFLRAYTPEDYDRLSLCVDAVIFSIDSRPVAGNYRKLNEQKLTVLLIRRNEHPYLDKWSLPGGFVGLEENLETAAARILADKTGIDSLYMEQLYTYGDCGRDPRMRIVSCAYLALIDRGRFQMGAGNIAAAWFEVEFDGERNILTLTGEGERISVHFEKSVARNGKIEFPVYSMVSSEGLAFDHGKIILDSLLRIRNKLEYTDIVFNLVQETFAITELQQIYEIILGKKLLAPAFRRKIAGKIQETGTFSDSRGHRPSQLFTYREGDSGDRE